MRTVAIVMCAIGAVLSSAVAVGSGAPARAADLPPYFKEIVGAQTSSPAEIGTKDILQLNTTMFELYGDAGQMFKKNSRAQHPLILALFSGAGGRFILYRPGMAAPMADVDHARARFQELGGCSVNLNAIVQLTTRKARKLSFIAGLVPLRLERSAMSALHSAACGFCCSRIRTSA
jgi:hypothetical protein